MTERSGIYVIEHMATERVYVGSASNISKRWSRHRKELRAGTHRNPHLQAAWSKYGERAFLFYVVEFTDDLTSREQAWMDKLDAVEHGFNLCPTARSSRGRKWSQTEYESRGKNRSNRKPESAESKDRRRERARSMARSQRKLTDAQAEDIRARYGDSRGNSRPHLRTSGRPTMQSLAAEYGISLSVVHAIIRRKAYA